jgi:hypothetical protein
MVDDKSRPAGKIERGSPVGRTTRSNMSCRKRRCLPSRLATSSSISAMTVTHRSARPGNSTDELQQRRRKRMVASVRQLLAVVALVLVAGCSDTDPVKAPSAETDPTPRVDTDPARRPGRGARLNRLAQTRRPTVHREQSRWRTREPLRISPQREDGNPAGFRWRSPRV